MIPDLNKFGMEYTDWIDRYLDGNLSDEENKHFEKSMQDDPAFARVVDMYRKLDRAARERMQEIIPEGRGREGLPADDHEKEFTARLESLASEYDQTRSKKQKMKRILIGSLSVAAGLALVVFLIVRTGYMVHDPEKIFSRYYRTYEGHIAAAGQIRSRDDLQSAIQAYLNHQPERTVELLENLPDSISAKTILHFYLGLSYLELGQTDKAIQNLLSASGFAGKENELPIDWYLGLAYLKKKNVRLAGEYFRKVSEDPSNRDLRKKAERILRKIQK